MKAEFEKAFLKGVRKHTSIKKQIEQKVRQIIEHPVELGEPLKGNLRGFYSCPVKRNFIIKKREMLNSLRVPIVPQHLTKLLSLCCWDPMMKCMVDGIIQV